MGKKSVLRGACRRPGTRTSALQEPTEDTGMRTSALQGLMEDPVSTLKSLEFIEPAFTQGNGIHRPYFL
jgi:hypothetical protein